MLLCLQRASLPVSYCSCAALPFSELANISKGTAMLPFHGDLPWLNAHHRCRTPCHGRVYDALPPESRLAHARLLQPRDPKQRKACVLHLAGTGDHTWSRRMNLGGPLLQQVSNTPFLPWSLLPNHKLSSGSLHVVKGRACIRAYSIGVADLRG